MGTHVHEDKQCCEYDNRKLNDKFGRENIDNAKGFFQLSNLVPEPNEGPSRAALRERRLLHCSSYHARPSATAMSRRFDSPTWSWDVVSEE